LVPNEHAPFFQLTLGAGPRHLIFHPTLSIVYIINELDNTITVCSYDADKGTLANIQTVSTLPTNFSGTSACAAIRISDDGKALYASNRFLNSIAVFKVENEGTLQWIQDQSTLGKTPRDINIDPSGKFLLVANQDSHTVNTFHIDPITYRLSPGTETKVPSASAILFL